MSKEKLNSTLEDIKWLHKIAGGSLSDAKKAIQETPDTFDAIEILLKRGVPLIAFAKKEDKERFLSNYPNKDTIIKRLLKEIPDKDEMTFNHYQEEARKTSIVPHDNQISYLALALCGEAGEAADKVKKIIRDKNNVLSDKDREALALELGDCLWYISNFAEVLGYSFEEIAQMNLEKIEKRQKNGTIHGDGDYR